MSSDFPNLTALQQGLGGIEPEAGIFAFPAVVEPPLFAQSGDSPFLSEQLAMTDGAWWPQETALARPPTVDHRPVGGVPKRLMDVAVASAALVVASPVMLVIAASTLVTDGGPVIFSHQRVGFSGKTFNCYKFRTMRRDAAEALERHLAENPEAAVEWRERKKLKRDPRVTVLGRLLRVSSLDELPQFLNVLRGEMSCVGPRPVVSDELGFYGASASEYLSARPGITGLWQVSGRNSVEYADRVLLDSQYVRNWSFRRDLMILLRTAFAVVRIDHTS